ncbi:MAG TPA: hypothetical protein VFA59_22080 [Vicinamibacterales bacterium]|nr:hypothetical protein [Vicinamibacterales bacterium]
MSIMTSQNLLTDAWVDDVKDLDTAVRHFVTARASRNECRVAFFELPDDPALHVNVTHKYQTENVPGWTGPADMPAGFVHNRTFHEMPSRQVIRHIREMVFAAPM